jgi:hypothetical protein
VLHALAFAFSSSLLSAPLRFSPGDAAKQKKLAFLALAFREFDVDKNNTMTAEEFRRALAGFMPDDAISQCFQAMSPGPDGKIHLEQWLDHLPAVTIQRLHSHQNAESWRQASKWTDQESLKTRRLRGSPYI